jgi:hypothetical protein
MRTNTRSIILVLALAVLGTACTTEEIALYLETTASTRDVLSADDLSNLRACESTDDYSAVSASGVYRGAYQFDQATWDAVSGRHFPWLVGRDPATVEPWWQDAVTRALWSERGDQPWPVCGHVV